MTDRKLLEDLEDRAREAHIESLRLKVSSYQYEFYNALLKRFKELLEIEWKYKELIR